MPEDIAHRQIVPQLFLEQSLDRQIPLARVVAEGEHGLPSGISGSFLATAASAAPDDGPTKMPSSFAQRTV